jgi:hypothetical protein
MTAALEYPPGCQVRARAQHGRVDVVMSSPERPVWMDATITSEPGGYVVHVSRLAWGVTRMLQNLFADDDEASAAEATARSLLRR